jgi:hypothetical protein
MSALSHNARRRNMSNTHLLEWQKIRDEYKQISLLKQSLNEPKDHIDYRIECIESLIGKETKVKNIAHFR